MTELAERVDNALQVTEDVYLARVYAAVDRKLAIVRETSRRCTARPQAAGPSWC